MSSSMIDDGPVPLHLPSILQNPANHALRQVEAHNAQQRERLLARRSARGVDRNAASGSGVKGKRVIRRHDNATFAGNPHVVQPRRGDYYPPIPLQARPTGPSFPSGALARSTAIPSVELPPRDPTSESSKNGAFNTSLKGVRNMLRKHGRRAEGFVGVVEKEIRDWLGSPAWTFVGDVEEGDGGWRVIDPHRVSISATDMERQNVQGRRLPPQHQITVVPPIPSHEGFAASVLELSRSPAHLTWHVTDSFERLVVHLLARYYELISWSEDHPTLNGANLRLTHILQPSLVRPRPPAHSLLSPETTDLSGQSSSDRDSVHGSTSDSDHRSDLDSDTASEAETERGSTAGDEPPDVEGYSLDPQAGDTTITGLETPSFEQAMAELDLRESGAPLERVVSSGSSMYASSEAGSEWSALGDSLTLPPVPPGEATAEGWSSVVPSAPGLNGHGLSGTLGAASRTIKRGGAGKKGWEEKPTFFDYLYGA